MSEDKEERRSLRTLQIFIAGVVLVIGIAALMALDHKRQRDAEERLDNFMRENGFATR